MDDFRETLEATLLQFGFESAENPASDRELINMVREMGEMIEDLETKLAGSRK